MSFVTENQPGVVADAPVDQVYGKLVKTLGLG